MGRRPLTLVILALVAFGGLGLLVLRGGSSRGSTAASLPDAPVVERAPARVELILATEVVTSEDEREAHK